MCREKKYKVFKRKMDIFLAKEKKHRQSLQWNEVLQVYNIFRSYNETYSGIKFISSGLWPPSRHYSKCLLISLYPRASQIPYSATWNFAKMRYMRENRGNQKNTDAVWQKCITQLFTIFNKQGRQVECLNYGSKFILNNMKSCWHLMVTKSVKSLYWWPPLPRGFLRATEFIPWVTQTQLGQWRSMECKGRFMLQWEYQSCTHWHGMVLKQGKEGFSHARGGRREKPTKSARVLADGKFPISNMDWACWAAAELLRKAHPWP